MKKLFTLALAGTLCATAVSFSGCELLDESLSGNSVQINVDSLENMTKEEWQQLSAKTNFENVTLDIWGAYVSGESMDIKDCLGSGRDIGVFKIDGESGWGCEYIYNSHEYFLDAEVLSAVKNLYIGTALAMLENFEDFTYKKEEQAFFSNKTISYDVNIVSCDNVIATLTVQNVKVEVLPDGYLGRISCDMKQQVLQEKNQQSGVAEDAWESDEVGFDVDVKVVFAFSEYGTTVLPAINSSGSNDDEDVESERENSWEDFSQVESKEESDMEKNDSETYQDSSMETDK